MHKGDIVQLDENVFYSPESLFLNNQYYMVVEEPADGIYVIINPINPAIMQRLKNEYSSMNDFRVIIKYLTLVQRRGEVFD